MSEGTGAVLAETFAALRPHLNERQRRLALGAAARALGRGGIRWVAGMTGAAESTVSRGVRELESGAAPSARVRTAGAGRRRPRGDGPGRGGGARVSGGVGEVESGAGRSAGVGTGGAGRRRLRDDDPGLVDALMALVEPDQRGDPESPLRWTTNSPRTRAAELTRQGHRVGPDTVAALLKQEGFSLQATSRTSEGARHPDRDGQFHYINDRVKEFTAAGQPVVSVDTKKKEVLGEDVVAGREWHRAGRPGRGRGHEGPGKGAPSGGALRHRRPGRRYRLGGGRVRRRGRAPLLGRDQAAGHRGCWRRRRLPGPRVEDRAGGLRPRRRPGGDGVPGPARDVEVEQDRAPAVLADQHQLARTSAEQPRGRGQHDRLHRDPHRAGGARRARSWRRSHRRHRLRRGHGRPAADRPRLARHGELHAAPQPPAPYRSRASKTAPSPTIGPRPGCTIPPSPAWGTPGSPPCWPRSSRTSWAPPRSACTTSTPATASCAAGPCRCPTGCWSPSSTTAGRPSAEPSPSCSARLVQPPGTPLPRWSPAWEPTDDAPAPPPTPAPHHTT